MHLLHTSRRELLDGLLERRDYAGIANLGLTLVEGPAAYDCGNYVLRELGVPGTPANLQLLRSLPKSDQLVAGIIFYGSPPRHMGLFDGLIVRSKWGHGPVFAHKIEDVPLLYGDEVHVTSSQVALERLHAAQFEHQFTD